MSDNCKYLTLEDLIGVVKKTAERCHVGEVALSNITKIQPYILIEKIPQGLFVEAHTAYHKAVEDFQNALGNELKNTNYRAANESRTQENYIIHYTVRIVSVK